MIDLLKHLPYLHAHGVETQILPETDCVDYAHLPEAYREAPSLGRFDGIIEPFSQEDEGLDPNCVCTAYGRRHAWSLILDLTHGTVVWHSDDRGSWGDEDHDLGETLPEDSPGRGAEVWAEWHEQPTYDINYFFSEFCRKRVNEMNWIPHPDGEIRCVDPRRELGREDAVRREVLADAGFPGDGEGRFDRGRWVGDERHCEL